MGSCLEGAVSAKDVFAGVKDVIICTQDGIQRLNIVGVWGLPDCCVVQKCQARPN